MKMKWLFVCVLVFTSCFCLDREESIAHFNSLRGVLKLEDIPGYLTSMIKQLEKQSNSKIDVRSAVILLKEEVNALELDSEVKKTLLHLCDSVMPSPMPKINMTSGAILWPQYLLAGRLEFSKKLKKALSPGSFRLVSRFSDLQESDIPDDVVVGLCEVFAGALLCIVPLPGARFIGGALITHGAYKMIDSATEYSQQRHGTKPCVDECGP